MFLPQQNAKKTEKTVMTAFKGYCHKEYVPAGMFYDMKNMTADAYPLLSTRKHRGVGNEANINEIAAVDQLYYIQDNKLVFAGQSLQLPLTGVKRQMVVSGAYLYIFPDKVYINTQEEVKKLYDMERVFTCSAGYKMAVFKVPYDWNFAKNYHNGVFTKPPKELLQQTGSRIYTLGDIGISIQSNPTTLYQCTEVEDFQDGKSVDNPITRWTPIDMTCVAIAIYDASGASAEIDGFKPGDYIAISGMPQAYESLNGMHKVLQVKQRFSGVNYPSNTASYIGCSVLVVEGQIHNDMYQFDRSSKNFSIDAVACEGVSFARKVPDLEYVTAHQNRLWGCNSENNEIYACVLGDPTNWRNYETVSSAAYTVSVGKYGKFTGACTYDGSIIFFKEDAIFRIYGTRPSNYQMTTLTCRGVEGNASKSIVNINEHVYYKGRDGIFLFNDAAPVLVSDNLGDEEYSHAVAGRYKDKYYISMQDRNGTYQLFCYDTGKDIWTKEDQVEVAGFINFESELYLVADSIYAVGGKNDYTEANGILAEEESFDWYVETGDLYTEELDNKYIAKLQFRMSLSGKLTILLQQDNEKWEPVYRVTEQKKKSITVPIIPARCGHLRIRLEGEGDFVLYALAMTMEKGSEL